MNRDCSDSVTQVQTIAVRVLLMRKYWGVLGGSHLRSVSISQGCWELESKVQKRADVTTISFLANNDTNITGNVNVVFVSKEYKVS